MPSQVVSVSVRIRCASSTTCSPTTTSGPIATRLNAKKEPGLLAFLMDRDDARFLRKLQKVSSAKTAKGGAKKSRTEIHEDCAASQCVCATADHFYEC